MKTLIFMRHAKSSWDNPLLSDHDRSLNKRGRNSAQKIGDWLRRQDYLPDQVLCSTSTRTRETFSGLGFDLGPLYTPDLYHADAEMIRTVISEEAKGQKLLVISHNPGMADFASRLAKKPPLHPRFPDYPTCATWVAELEIDSWANIPWSSAKTVDFAVPREL